MLKRYDLPACPVETTLMMMGDRWKVLIVRELLSGTKRFGQLKKGLSGISQKTLTEHLRIMEEHGLVERKVYAEIPPKVEYSLSELGKSLKPILDALCKWGEQFQKNAKSKTTKTEQLDFLIRRLNPQTEIPKSTDDKMFLFRSLVNVREPVPIDDDFLSVQDNFLKSVIAEKGITDIDSLEPLQNNLYLWRGDITTLKIGAIVNAANSAMLGCFMPCHACIDNAIHTFAGVQLRLECAKIMQEQGHPEPTGTAKITPAFNLPSDYILHTVGPIIRGNLKNEDKQQLADCYNSCLSLTEKHKIKSIAFCCISTGEFHFPNEEAADIATNTVTNFLTTSKYIEKVVFNVFKEQDEIIYRRLLG
jgi:O-acetyl-ADP-ribose deacetylase (regulator of RNase III)/DNA-binding HxlR family transcriptional regulator